MQLRLRTVRVSTYGGALAGQAVADLYTTERAPLTAADVSLTSGCSHALQMSIEVRTAQHMRARHMCAPSIRTRRVAQGQFCHAMREPAAVMTCAWGRGTQVLCNPGDTLLIPNPGFPLYQTIADHLRLALPAPPCTLPPPHPS
jgi:aspartate/methionine/tyrosine aminotransferase